MFTLLTSIENFIFIGIPIHSIQTGKIKDIQIEKEEIKLSLFADDMILYMENLKTIKFKNYQSYTVNLVKLQNKKSIHRNHLHFLYTNNEKSERDIKELIPFTIATKRMKYLGINLPKERKELYTGNYDNDKRNQR